MSQKKKKKNGRKRARMETSKPENERIKLNYAWSLCMLNFSMSKSGGGNVIVDDDDDDDVDENNNWLRNLYTHYMRECIYKFSIKL